METVTDRTTQFSAAVALIYEAHLGRAQREEMNRALCMLLRADELLFTAVGNGETPGDLLSARRDSGCSGGGEVPGLTALDALPGRTTGHVLSLDVMDRGYDKLTLLVLRNPGHAPFLEGDLEWLTLLRPHFRNAGFIKSLMPDGVIGCAAGSQLIRSMFEGLAITTIDAKVEWLNPIAREILSAGQGLTCVNDQLRAGRAFETTQLEALIRDAACGRPGVMLVGHTSMWLPYGLVLTPLEFEFGLATSTPNGSERRFVLVTIKDMRRHVDVIVDRLAKVFGLTKVEQRIAALLLTGHGLQDAAVTTGKSLTTVRKQLSSMLTKTGAHSQAELLSMFLSVPSLL